MTRFRFHDEEGPETDIANGVGIVRAIHQANSVRPILLLSFKDFGNKAAKSIDDMGACREPGLAWHQTTLCGWWVLGARTPLLPRGCCMASVCPDHFCVLLPLLRHS